MKRLSLGFLLLLLLALPALAVAQEQEGVWDLSEFFTITDLQLQFNFPVGWVYDTSQGITLAENETDLAAQVDDDGATIPEGVTLTLSAVPLDALELEATATLEEVVEALAAAANLTIDDQAEFALMTRRVLVIFGTGPDGRDGAAAVWTQDGLVVYLSMGTPDRDTTDALAYSFGEVLASLRPLEPLELGDPIEMYGFPDYTMRYPADWTLVTDPIVTIAEYEDDIARLAGTVEGEKEGVVVIVAVAPVADVITGDNPTPGDFVQTLIDTGAYVEPYVVTEHVLFEQPAIQFWATHSTGGPTMMTVGIVDDLIFLLSVSAPTEEQMAAFQPTWIAMLQSIQATEP